MRYLFFDIECADGNKAICEFGYVLCDERFAIIQQRNVLMDPECAFHLTNRPGQKDLVLTYPYEEYRKHMTFDDAYDNIKFLMTQKDLLIFGHSVTNDIRYIIKDCNRYFLDKFDYVAYDVQKMLPLFDAHNKKYTSLENAFHDIVPESVRSALQDHRAVDDAMKTMLVLKAMVDGLEFTVKDLVEACPDSKVSALDYWREYKENKKQRNAREKSKHVKNECQALWGELYRRCAPKLEDINSIGKIVTVSAEAKRHPEGLRAVTKHIEDQDYVAYDKISGSDFLIAFDEMDREHLAKGLKYPYAGRIVTIKEFASME